MEMAKSRVIQIIRILGQSKKTMTSEELCQLLDISPRTLRNDLKENRELLSYYEMSVQSFPGKGYKLVIHDQTKYYDFVEDAMREESNRQLVIPIYPEDRIQYLIRKLLTYKGYIKMDDLAEEIFVSRSTLNNDLKEVKERLRYFHLDISSKPSYGIKVEGSEFHKRSCIAEYYFHGESNDNIFVNRTKSISSKHDEIAEILYESMVEENFKLTDIGFQNLVVHIIIALLRLEENDGLRDEEYDKSILETKEYEMASVICEKLEKAYKVVFPKIEVYYVALHLSGKKAVQYSTTHLFMNDDNAKFLQKIFEIIYQQYQIDFSSDIELYTALSLHFQPMMNRLKYGMNITNPLVEQIKTENMEAFEMSVLVAHVIEEEYGYSVSESEIGYIALHFSLSLERYRNNQLKKNIIIVCASGMGSSQILLHKIRQKFFQSIDNIYVTELYELKEIEQKNFDFIISTVPVLFKTQIPVVQVQYFLDEEDNYKIQNAIYMKDDQLSFIDRFFKEELFFTHLTSKNKEDIIYEMIASIRKIKNLPDEFEEEVISREEYSVTEFGNNIAMPHPMHPLTDETFVSVGILPKAIKWKRKMVKFVFLLSVEKGHSEDLNLFHEALSALVMDKKALIDFEKEPTISNLKTILKRIAKEHEGQEDIFM